MALEYEISGRPDFVGLFYPGIPDDIEERMAKRTADDVAVPGICPMFIVNARVDNLTPAEKCIAFYSMLLKAGVNAELHVFNKGGHGFSLGDGRGEAPAMWPRSFAAWMRDVGMMGE